MMYALDATTGDVKWQFASGATVYSGPAIVNGVVYWELAIRQGASASARRGRRSSTRSTRELKSRDHPFTPQIRAPERPGERDEAVAAARSSSITARSDATLRSRGTRTSC